MDAQGPDRIDAGRACGLAGAVADVVRLVLLGQVRPAWEALRAFEERDLRALQGASEALGTLIEDVLAAFE